MSESRSTRVLTRIAANWRPLLLVPILVVYGTFSSSTPDDPGIWEGVIGLGLLLLVGAMTALRALGGDRLSERPLIPPLVLVAFIWLLTIPTAMGMLNGYKAEDFIRDVVPLLYFLLPVLLVPYLVRAPESWKLAMTWGLCYVGIAYAVRFFNEAEGELWVQTVYGGMSAFIIDPAVLFAATFLLILALVRFYDGRYVSSVVLLGLGAIVFSAIVAATVRAQIGLVLLALICVIWLQVFHQPLRLRSWLPFVAATCVLFAIPDVEVWFENVYMVIALKQEEVGLNAREIEMAEVLEFLREDPYALVVGAGWGAKLELSTSGAVVRYTHNLPIYLLWKTGAIGIALTTAIAWWILRHLMRLARSAYREPQLMPFGLACFNVCAVNVILAGGYKSLSFGLVLCLIVVCGKSAIHEYRRQRADLSQPLVTSPPLSRHT